MSLDTSGKNVEAPATNHLDPKGAWHSRLPPWTLILLILLFVGAIRIRLLDVPLERDEGEYAYAGQLMLQGIPPYHLAYNMKFPGTYGAYALMMAVFGQTIAGIHLGFMMVNAGAIVLIYLLGKRLFTTEAGVAASAAYALLSVSAGVLGTQAHATHFVVLAALGGTLLLVQAIDTGRFSMLLWSGLLYGIAVLMKQHAVLFVIFGGSYLIWNHFTQHCAGGLSIGKKLALFFCGVSLPVALTGFALWRAGVFGKFWFWTVSYAREYVLENSFSNGVVAFRQTFPSVVGPNLVIWIVALAGLVLIWWKNQKRPQAVFLTGFLVFSFLALCPGFYFREHYFVLILPAVAMLAGAAVSSARRTGPRATLLLYGLFGAALVVSIVQQHEFLFQMSPFEVSRAMYGYNPFPEAVQVADYIRAHSTKDARIAVLGSEPEIPFYADRHSATGYIYMYSLMEPQPYASTMQDELIRDIETARPDFVVFVTASVSWLRRPDSPNQIFDWWKTYRSQHYQVVGVADIVSANHTEYRWGEIGAYLPRSPSLVWVYKRTDF